MPDASSPTVQRPTRSDPISVRFTETDRHLIEVAAKSDGLRLSTFLRRAGLVAARQRLLSAVGGEEEERLLEGDK